MTYTGAKAAVKHFAAKKGLFAGATDVSGIVTLLIFGALTDRLSWYAVVDRLVCGMGGVSACKPGLGEITCRQPSMSQGFAYWYDSRAVERLDCDRRKMPRRWVNVILDGRRRPDVVDTALNRT